jgi:monovalent cation:H+ antiporter-2, CPA2 family
MQLNSLAVISSRIIGKAAERKRGRAMIETLLMGIPLLNEIVIIFGLSIAIFFICHQVRLPALVGFLITGTLAGPHGFRLIGAVHEVEILAEIGVVLLLFTIGIEFSLQNLLQIKRAVLLGGSLQVAFTIGTVFLLLKQRGWVSNEAVFIGFLISLSSTAIVLKLMQERGEMESPQGRMALAILIFQDIAVVPMILFTPLLAGASGEIGKSLLLLAGKGIGVLIFVYISTKWLVPTFLYQIARTRSRELFLLSIVAICFAVALLTSFMGLSLALGAFLAGLIISESEYSHQALGNILPFRDVFTSLFFVSIGMLLDIKPIMENPGQILLLVITVIALKTILCGLAIGILGYPLRTMIIGGLTLSQIAEFSFVLSKAGLSYNLLDQQTYQTFLAVSIISMVASPFLIMLAPRLADKVMTWPLPERIKAGITASSNLPDKIAGEHLEDHLIIVGFGINGRNVARSAKVTGIPYIVIEMNAETIKNEQLKGQPIY